MHEESTALAPVSPVVAKLYPLLREHGIEPFEFRGAPAFLPRQVAAVLGYSSTNRMLSWLAAQGDAGLTDEITGGDLATVKGLDIPGLVGGRTSWRETVLRLPGLLRILGDSRKAQVGPFAEQFRRWQAEAMRAFLDAALAPAPTTPEPPKQIATAAEQVRAALATDRYVLARALTVSELVAHTKLARVQARRDREEDRERTRRMRAHDAKILREERAPRRPRKPTAPG